MRLKLRQLAARHQVINDAVIIPLAPPTGTPMVLSGLASTSHVDLDFCKFAPGAFGLMPARLPRLLWKHDEAIIAGEIDYLGHDRNGSLAIIATVSHELARRAGAWSIGGRIIDYKICNADSGNFFAHITRAEIDHVALTDCPANPHALVTARYRPSAIGQLYALAAAKAAALARFTAILRHQQGAAP